MTSYIIVNIAIFTLVLLNRISKIFLDGAKPLVVLDLAFALAMIAWSIHLYGNNPA